MRRQPQPRIQHHAILPKHPPRLREAVLDRELDPADRLVGRRRLVPHHARVLGRVVRGRGTELDPDVVRRRRAGKVVEEPVGDLRRRGGSAVDGVAALGGHGGQGGKERQVAVVVAEAERRLRVHGVADGVGFGQHARRVLLKGVGTQFQRQGQAGRAVEVLLTQLHNFEAGVHVGQFEHGGVVEQKVLG